MTKNVKKTASPKAIGYIIIAAVVVIAAIIICATSIVTVPTGHTGVLVTFGRVEEGVLAEGIHFKLPWQNVVSMDNRTQKNALTVQAFSSDIQQVDIACSVNYSINSATAQELYRKVGANYYSTIMENRINENIKAVFSQYSAENLISSRSELSTKLTSQLSGEMKEHGINIISVSIENIDFSDKYTDAVESKQVAEQAKLQAQIEQEQKTMEQRAEAERAKITAESQAEVKEIQAEAEAKIISIKAAAEAEAMRIKAEAEALANIQISDSVTNELIEYLIIQGWDGKLPTVMGDGTVSIFDILKAQEKEEVQP